MKQFLMLAGVTAAVVLSTSVPVQAQTTTELSEAEFERIYTAMDTNKDRRISRTEYANYQASAFDSWDLGRGGMLTREQIRTRQFERELRKSDGNPQGNSPLAYQKK